MFKEKTSKLAKGSIKYHTGGSGRPLVHLHGAGGVRPNAGLEALAKNLTVYMPVLPGFDGSSELPGIDSMESLADLVADFIDQEIGEAADVVGVSFGGWLAAWLAVRHPTKVGQLCLENPAGFRPKSAPKPSDDPEIRKHQMYAYPDRLPPETKSDAVLAKNRSMLSHYHGATSFDEKLAGQLGKIECLTMIMHGTRDGRVPEEAVQLLKRDIPRSHLIYVYDAAHSIETDQPARFAHLLADFMERAEAFLVNQGTPDGRPQQVL
ncbi:MAG: alpha/beta hydrolase [Alphaproteobacteria bacterium]